MVDIARNVRGSVKMERENSESELRGHEIKALVEKKDVISKDALREKEKTKRKMYESL